MSEHLAGDRTSRRAPAWLTGNVLALGFVSLLTDAASEMVIPLLPVLLGTMGGGAIALRGVPAADGARGRAAGGRGGAPGPLTDRFRCAPVEPGRDLEGSGRFE